MFPDRVTMLCKWSVYEFDDCIFINYDRNCLHSCPKPGDAGGDFMTYGSYIDYIWLRHIAGCVGRWFFERS